MLGSAGFPALAARGISDCKPHRQPTQIGRSGSPCSNSTHTPAPIGGTMYTPIGGPVGPASGTHGSAQLEGIRPRTSGTINCNLPRCSGSTFRKTVPRYLPRYVLFGLAVMVQPPGSAKSTHLAKV